MNRRIVICGVIVLILVVLGIVLCTPNDINLADNHLYGITMSELQIPSSFGAPFQAVLCVGVEDKGQIDYEGRRPWFDEVIEGFKEAYLDADMYFEVELIEFVSTTTTERGLIGEAQNALAEMYPDRDWTLILVYSLRELTSENQDIFGSTVEHNYAYLGDTIDRGVNSDIEYATWLAVHETGHRWITANRMDVVDSGIYSLKQHHYIDDDSGCVMGDSRQFGFIKYPTRISLTWRTGIVPRFGSYCKMLLPSQSTRLPARLHWRKRPEVEYWITPIDLKDFSSWGEIVTPSPLFENPPLTNEDAGRIALEQLLLWFPNIAESEYPPRIIIVYKSHPNKFGVFIWWRAKMNNPFSVGFASVDVSDEGYVLGIPHYRALF